VRYSRLERFHSCSRKFRARTHFGVPQFASRILMPMAKNRNSAGRKIRILHRPACLSFGNFICGFLLWKIAPEYDRIKENVGGILNGSCSEQCGAI
jgi:hypothetical protein